MITPELLDKILLEWSYRCDKGYPDVDNPADWLVLENVLVEMGITFPSNGTILSEISQSDISTDPTDVKESLVCAFVDAGLVDKKIFNSYRDCLDMQLDAKNKEKLVSEIKKTLTTVTKSYGKNYGASGYSSIPSYVAQVLLNIKEHKRDLQIINNALSIADAIIGEFSGISAGMVDRSTRFTDIRKHAVQLIDDNYNIPRYYPDNWCPGDVYIIKNSSAVDSALSTNSLNVGKKSLNNFFYGSDNKKGPIVAVSLKMQKAQAGKGTTFVKNVVVSDVSTKEKLGKDPDNQQIIKFRDIARRLVTYYINSDAWKTSDTILDKVRKSVIGLSKYQSIQAPTKTTETRELIKFLGNTKNKKLIQQNIDSVNARLGKSINTVNTCKQAYTRFVKELKNMDIKKVTGNFENFYKEIESTNKQNNKGKLNTTELQTLLARKAATYDLASTLIEKWTENTKKISPAFEKYLGTVKNPFVAVTLFAIAQHGLNPNFYKATGKNNASIASIHEFPSNSTVDETNVTENLKIVDSPGEAGFSIEYDLTVNNTKYHTVLSFRFAKSEIRIEVEKLSEV